MSQTPAVSGKQLVKILEGQGWYVYKARPRQPPHHASPEHPRRDPGPGPRHQQIKRGTLGNILRTAGISREQLNRLT